KEKFSGWGPGYNSELSNHIVINDAYSERGTDWWEIDGLLLHEIGHCLGLHHTWLSSQKQLFEFECDTGQGWNVNNHLMAYNPAQSYNTPLQDAHMRRLLLTSWRSKQLGPTPSNSDTYVFDYDYELTETNSINWVGNILVKSGNTLTIKGLLQMHPNRKITIERGAQLVVDGGTITSCEEWEGIIVEGDAEHFSQIDAGRVELKNDATIGYARNAISMNPVHIPWPETPKYYGGLVIANGANFINCRRAVQFMRYGTGILKDESSFTKCTFDGSKYAITLWSNNGVKVDECIFTNITDYAIHPYNSEIFVENGCVFENMPMGLNILTTYPQPFAPQIGNGFTNSNDFDCYEYGIHATSTGSTDPLMIENNNFFGGQVGVQINGDSYFEVHHNDVLDYDNAVVEEVSAVAAISTGFWPNSIRENNVSSNLYGSQAIWNNPGLKYAFNCFAFNTLTDVLVSDGSIHPHQDADLYDNDDSDYTEAGNCFTKADVPEIDNFGNPIINYYINEVLQSGDCKFLDNPVNVNAVTGDGADVLTQCGSLYSPGNINVSSFCGGPFKTKLEITNRIASIQAYITQIENTTYPSENYKKYLLAKYNRCLDRLLAQVGIVILDPEEEPIDDPKGQLRKEDFIAFYSAQSDFNYQILAYGMMLQFDEIGRARTYLNALIADTEEKQDFVWAQNLYLDYLENRAGYTLSSSDEIQLLDYAQKRFPLAGYARSIYEVLTNIKVDLALPSRPNATPRNTTSKENPIKVNGFPNPVNDVYNIVISGVEQPERYEAYLMDAQGRMVRTFVLDHSIRTELNFSTLQNGVYALIVKNEKGEVHYSTKVVIIH
ncbi:MAG: T9SS type A sorting domain-containing protein, partial [Bacteroidota bacterium]